ncbi:hypothetical protein ACWC0A_09905 [Streptomyces scopuliridis]
MMRCTGRLDTAQVFARRDRFVTDWDDTGQAEWVKSIGADLFRGPRRVVVTRDDGARHRRRGPAQAAAARGRPLSTVSEIY